jgi:hypothetical protein
MSSKGTPPGMKFSARITMRDGQVRVLDSFPVPGDEARTEVFILRIQLESFDETTIDGVPVFY